MYDDIANKGPLIPRYKRIGMIGFPGWKKQVPREELKRVRQMTKLTAGDGYDSETFFHDAEPLGAFINQYQGILKRLKDK